MQSAFIQEVAPDDWLAEVYDDDELVAGGHFADRNQAQIWVERVMEEL